MHCLKAFGMLPKRAVRHYLRDSIRAQAPAYSKDGLCKLTDFGTCAKLSAALGGATVRLPAREERLASDRGSRISRAA
eukprot:gene5021-15609_t